MANKKRIPRRRLRLWPLEIAAGILLLTIVFIISTRGDIARTEAELREKVNYIKEQCNNYNRLNLASETKSLMRIIESSKQVAQSMAYESQLDGTVLPDTERMAGYVRENYLTGMAVLSADGKVLAQYGTDSLWNDGLQE